jgi:hypothetical protein
MHPDERSFVLLVPEVEAALTRLTEPRFSTKRIIEEVRAQPEGETAYQAALQEYLQSGTDDRMARLIVHGQVIPEILRHSGQVRFGGFIHGQPEENDGYAVPSWWRRQ